MDLNELIQDVTPSCVNLISCCPWMISYTRPFPSFSACCNEPIEKQTLPNFGVEIWIWTSWYRMSPPSCPWTRQFYRIENLHPVGQTATASAQRLHKRHISHKRWIINTKNVYLSRQNTQSTTKSYKIAALWCNFYLILSSLVSTGLYVLWRLFYIRRHYNRGIMGRVAQSV